ncbi:TonB-dependent receptor [Stakelama sp. CBK3Z-3]|uniref:TonB-dependent receptor n=1 Tax=Stakelama flava TaxID=2860338 RepID=A0ABS6XLR8_9SPHN|nr:TonB-dependent receptor [Stakelama flava]MBW4331160.1 TonB-dependent receptor [Stakelama flava]
MRNHLFAGAAIAAFCLPAAPAMAQQITTGIEGTVQDESGTPIANATVTVTDTRTDNVRTLTTGANGNFSLGNLTPGGPYTVMASAPGYEGQTVNGLTTSLQGNTSLAFNLTSGAGDIVVTAARANVTQLAVGPGTSFGTEALEQLPSFNRDVRDVIRIDPRVSLDREDASTGGDGQDHISCLGGNDRGNAFTVDGISQGDIYGLNGTGFASRSSTPIPYDAIREVQVQFAPYDVEYGQFTGCAINAITKSGTNQFHGSGFFEYSDNSLRGDKVQGQDVAPVEEQKNWGVSLGGPIIKDHLFFFGAYSHQETGNAFDYGPTGSGAANELAGVTVDDFNRVSDILSNTYGIDTGGLATNLPYENERYFGRLDWHISDAQRLELTYQHLEENSVKDGDYYTGTGPTIAGYNNFYNSGTNSDYYSARLYSDWTDNFSTELRFSHSKVRDLQDPVGGGEAQSDNPIPRIVVGVTQDDGTNGLIVAGPDVYRTANDLRTKLDQGAFIAKLNQGNHKLKFGAEINQASIFNLFVSDATGTLYFTSIDDLANGILSDGTRTSSLYASTVTAGNAVGATGNFSATGDVNSAAAAFTRTIFSVYAQDDWKVNDRLGIVAGARVDWYDGGRPGNNPNFIDRYGYSNAIGFSNLDPSVMPRVAATYDLGDFAIFSQPRLRLGAGMFSGGDPLVWFANAFQNNGYGYAQGTTLSSACPDGPISVLDNGTFTGVPSCIASQGISSASQGLGDTQSTDPNIKMPSVLRLNAGWESGLDFASSGFFSNWQLKLDYIYSRYTNPLALVDLSLTPDIRAGLNGYTVDGRPIYAAIDPTVDGCNAVYQGSNPAPQWANVTEACFNTSRDDEIMLTNSKGYTSQIASFLLQKHFDGGVFTPGGSINFSIGYAYTDAHDRRTFGSSQATSNFNNTATFDLQNPEEATSAYSSKHNITLDLRFAEEFVSDLKTRLGISFVARSGRPFSLTFDGSYFSNGEAGNDSALLYVPNGVDDANLSPESDPDAVAELVDFTQSLDCAKGYAGRTIARNTCTNDWYYDMDLTFSQDLPGPGRFFGVDDKIRLYATIDNFLNLLDSDWNAQHRRSYTGFQDVASIDGVDDQGRYIISEANTDNYYKDEFINTSSSVWRLKVGVSYNF